MTYVAELQPLLRDARGIVSFVEVEPQTLWRSRGPGLLPRIHEAALRVVQDLDLQPLAHGVGMPVGGSVVPGDAEMQLLARTLDALRPPWFSEHLSFNRVAAGAGDVWAGFLLPPRQSPETVAIVAGQIARYVRLLGLPFAFETGVNYLRPAPGDMGDGEFFAAVATEADCDILLDLHNLHVNERNGREPWKNVVASLPSGRIREIHVAGGSQLDGYWLDSHAGLVSDPLLEGLEQLLPTLPRLEAVTFEILPMHVERVGLDAIGRQLERLQALCNHAAPRIARPPRAPAVVLRDPDAAAIDGSAAVVVREYENDLFAAIASVSSADPGLAIYRRLIADFRSGAVAQCMRGTVTLLFLSLGEARTTQLMHDYLRDFPARPFPDEEALQFGRYLRNCDLSVPHLADVQAFETAVLEAGQTGRPDLLQMEHDPEKVFGALLEGRLPGDLPSELTCIQLS